MQYCHHSACGDVEGVYGEELSTCLSTESDTTGTVNETCQKCPCGNSALGAMYAESAERGR